MKTDNLADLYGLAALRWSDIESGLVAGIPQAPHSSGPDRHTCWLSTIDPDGRPHLTALGMLWAEGTFWFETGPRTRKARNLARDPRCAVSVATRSFDLSVEGTAERITDPETVARMALRWADAGWPCRVDESGRALTAEYSAPSAGPPPWQIYRVTASAASAVATEEPGGATRWRFDRA